MTAVWKAKQFNLTLKDENGNTLKTDTLEFGREFDLPAPNLPENLLFVGWAENGERLTDNTYTLSEEKDVTLVALTEQKQVTTTVTENSTSEKEDKPKNGKKWLLGAGGLVVLVVIFKALKKKPSPPANPPVEQPGANMPKIGTPIHRLTNTTDNSSGNMNGSEPQPPTNNTEGGK